MGTWSKTFSELNRLLDQQKVVGQSENVQIYWEFQNLESKNLISKWTKIRAIQELAPVLLKSEANDCGSRNGASIKPIKFQIEQILERFCFRLKLSALNGFS